MPVPIDAGLSGRGAGGVRLARAVSTAPDRVATPGDLGLTDLGRQLSARQEEEDRKAARLKTVEVSNRAATDWQERLDAAAAEYEGAEGGFADGFVEEMEASFDDYLDGLSPDAADAAELRLRELSGQYARSALSVEGKKREHYALAGASRQGDIAVNRVRSDPAFYATAMENTDIIAGALPEGLRDGWAAEQRAVLTDAYVRAAIEADPAAAKGDLADGDLDRYLRPGDKDVLSRAADRAIAAEEAEAERAREKAIRAAEEAEEDRLYTDYERLQILDAEGSLTQARVDQYFPEDSEGRALHYRRMLIEDLRREDAASKKARETREAVQRAASGQSDPATSEGREDIDALYDEMLKRAAPEGVRAQPAAAVNLALVTAETHGHIPKTAADSLSWMAAAGSEEEKATALDAIARFAEVNPGLARQAFSAGEIETAEAAAEMVYAGGAPQDVVQRLARKEAQGPGREAALKDGRKQAKALTEQDLQKALANPSRALSATSWAIPFVDDDGAPIASLPARRKAMALYQDYAAEAYADTEDWKAARAMAGARLRRVYGTSRVTGRSRMMAYPPEAHVPGGNQGAGKWMAQEFEGALADAMPGLAASKASLVADNRTAAEVQNGRNPSWLVVYEDEDGVWQTMEKRFAFDVEGRAATARAEAAARLGEMEARRERGRDLSDLVEDAAADLPEIQTEL